MKKKKLKSYIISTRNTNSGRLIFKTKIAGIKWSDFVCFLSRLLCFGGCWGDGLHMCVCKCIIIIITLPLWKKIPLCSKHGFKIIVKTCIMLLLLCILLYLNFRRSYSEPRFIIYNYNEIKYCPKVNIWNLTSKGTHYWGLQNWRMTIYLNFTNV